MGRAHHHDHLEVDPLKLTKQQFPLPCSLLPLVMQRYADPANAAQPGQEMATEELHAYLRSADLTSTAPLEAVLTQAEQIGDPGLPSAEQVAALRWLAASLKAWRNDFPLEEPLAGKLRQVDTALAVAAVTDPNFLFPGAHPLHQVLDTLQESAVGWQADLGRAGQALEQQVERTIAESLAWLEDRSTDLGALAADLDKAARRSAERVSRMTRRLAEGEQGKQRTVLARQQAGNTLNAWFKQYPAPAEVGEFLTGPWYDSAQLVWLKFGDQSEQWQKFCATGEQLLASMQNLADGDESGRQKRLQLVATLPDRLRKWALSMQSEQEAMDQFLGVLEYNHLRLLRFQQLELAWIPQLSVDNGGSESSEHDSLPEGIEPDQWFQVQNGKQTMRMQLVTLQQTSGQLLFCNHAGLKVGEISLGKFSRLLEQERVRALDYGASFSRSLAATAGIDSTETLTQLTGIEASAASPHPTPTPTPEADSEPTPAVPAEPANDAIPDLPTGTWMGFHDGETPLLAKLAMHDRERGLYIFVNREGIKLRQLHRDEFLELIERGLVDIMESRTNFRDLVKQKREQLEP